ncbi:uncharacterized protein SCHCODRAFT_02068975 [Schizophyllum commune H4-8]|uniref:uncharacterized protein n=1 Tax=Schizophyllum commune (strain H4-8 / FGSC 9210) TaxID=578458 RepID=UPI00215FA3DD|nr:uncharacterized protein SCHCODRAFT_02068975 [Schizophyllum commune H4-8]KAI5887626.1 hypothetical protein SCHCODRAFT_02068975 [Schizophyllum commune H4-8]
MEQTSQQTVTQVATRSARQPFPIHDLPNELINHILTLSVPSELVDPKPGSVGRAYSDLRAFLIQCGVLDYPTLLSHVCSKWRDLIRANPTVWSYILVSATGWLEMRPEDYERPLALSGDEPLTLNVDIRVASITDLLSSPPFSKHIHRIRTLCIDICPGGGAKPLFPIIEKLATPSLEILRIFNLSNMHDCSPWRFDEGHQQRVILHNAPRLKQLSLHGSWACADLTERDQARDAFPFGNLGAKAWHGIDWSRLTVLRLPDISRWAHDLLILVASAPQLRALQCTVLGEPEDLVENDPELQHHWRDSEEGEDEEEPTEEERREAAAQALHGLTRPQSRADFMRKRRTIMGPHVLAYLSELNISVHHSDRGPSAFSDITDQRSGLAKFLGGLITPALASLTVTALKGLAVEIVHHSVFNDHHSDGYDSGSYHSNGYHSDGYESEDHALDGYGPDCFGSDDASGTETDAQEGGAVNFLLRPHLAALIERSQCTIRHLSLTEVFVSLQELFSLIELCHELRSLHLCNPLREMGSSLIRGFATRTDQDGRLLAPKLQRLVIKSVCQIWGPRFPVSAVLDMIDVRWPPGSSDTPVYVEVVHSPKGEYEKGTPRSAVQERMHRRLVNMQARKDLQLVIGKPQGVGMHLWFGRAWDNV